MALLLPGEPLLWQLAEQVAAGELIGAGLGEDRSDWAAAHGIRVEWQPVETAKIRVDDLESRDPDALQTFTFEVAKVDRRGQEILPRQQGSGRFFVEPLGDQAAPYLEMVAIPGGSFLRGSPEDEGDDNEHPQRWVTVPPFYMSKYPVTQAQWRAVAAMTHLQHSLDLKPAPSEFTGDDLLPVESVSWLEAQEFCRRVTALAQRKFKQVAWECRLPTEAEWEYACRAGTTTPFHFGPTISTQLANYHGNYTYGQGQKGEYRARTTIVGSFGVANNFGLYDMHGNVWEWCADHMFTNIDRIMRGGSFNFNPNYCRSAYRSSHSIDYVDYNVGFRVVYALAKNF